MAISRRILCGRHPVHGIFGPLRGIFIRRERVGLNSANLNKIVPANTERILEQARIHCGADILSSYAQTVEVSASKGISPRASVFRMLNGNLGTSLSAVTIWRMFSPSTIHVTWLVQPVCLGILPGAAALSWGFPEALVKLLLHERRL